MGTSSPRTVAAGLLLAVTSVAGCSPTAGSAPTAPATSATIDGAVLYRYPTNPAGGQGAAYVQVVDLRKIGVDQILGEREPGAPDPANYYPEGPGSPRFRRLTVAEMQKGCGARYGTRAFSAVNFSFFEEYDESTRLSFPVKTGGQVVTGGSSPYGPIARPADPYFRHVVLRALSWTEGRAEISAFDASDGSPLRRPELPEAVVTYAWSDHPSRALGGDPANRYQLLGTLDNDGRDGAESLVIATVTGSTLEAAAELLRRHGVTGDVLTFDGGVSTYLWSAAEGELVAPIGGTGAGAPALPHYLCLYARS